MNEGIARVDREGQITARRVDDPLTPIVIPGHKSRFINARVLTVDPVLLRARKRRNAGSGIGPVKPLIAVEFKGRRLGARPLFLRYQAGLAAQ